MAILIPPTVLSTTFDEERPEALKVQWFFFSIMFFFVTFGFAYIDFIGLYGLYGCVVLIKGTKMMVVLPCLKIEEERNQIDKFWRLFPRLTMI
jgi:hypothetical protein